jgi:hypothetical protein
VLLQGLPLDERRGLDISEEWSSKSPYFHLPLNSQRDTFAEVEDFFLLRGHPREAEQQIDLKLDSIIEHIERAQKASMDDSDNLYITFSSATEDQSGSYLNSDVNPKVRSSILLACSH